MNTSSAIEDRESSVQDDLGSSRYMVDDIGARKWGEVYGARAVAEGTIPQIPQDATLTDLPPVESMSYRPEIRAPSVKERVDRFRILQKWEGTVLELSCDGFLARLNDLTADGTPEEAEFPTEEVPPEDRELISPGAVFYWSIGYLDQLSGQRIRASIIRFRRLPAWSKKDIEEAQRSAERIARIWES